MTLEKLRDALEEIICTLGPSPGCKNCCDGCRAEIEIALQVALNALEVSYVEVSHVRAAHSH